MDCHDLAIVGVTQGNAVGRLVNTFVCELGTQFSGDNHIDKLRIGGHTKNL